MSDSCFACNDACQKCSREIDAQAIETKRRIASRLYPGRDVTPPKLCTACVWDAIVNMDDDSAPAAREGR